MSYWNGNACVNCVDHVFVSPIGVGAPQGSQLLPRYLLGGGAAVHSVSRLCFCLPVCILFVLLIV